LFGRLVTDFAFMVNNNSAANQDIKKD